MPCLIALSAFFAPRIVLAVLIVAGYVGPAYQSFFVPMLGFFFMPFTTLAYAVGMRTNGAVEGKWFFFTLIAALADMGVLGGGVQTRRYMPNLDRMKRG